MWLVPETVDKDSQTGQRWSQNHRNSGEDWSKGTLEHRT